MSMALVWNLDLLTVRPQVVRVGNNTSAMLILNTGDPQGCMLSPLLYSLFTHDCMTKPDSNTIIHFADDTTVVAFGCMMRQPTGSRSETWQCGGKTTSSFNMSKTKEVIVDYRKRRHKHTAILIDRAVVEQVESFKFLWCPHHQQTIMVQTH